eukprot:COSAG04_NODE_274_length_18488_cov_35.031377_16_plen_151_part_00
MPEVCLYTFFACTCRRFSRVFWLFWLFFRCSTPEPHIRRQVGAALDAEINAFLDPTDSDSDKEDGDELGDMGAWGEVEEYDRPGNMHVTKSLGLTPQVRTLCIDLCLFSASVLRLLCKGDECAVLCSAGVQKDTTAYGDAVRAAHLGDDD